MLERAGLISRSKQAQFRPCKLEVQALQEAGNFLEQYRQFWEQSLDRLDDNDWCTTATVPHRLHLPTTRKA